MTVVNGVRVVSNSEVQAFKWCRRHWWLSWYRGLTPRTESVSSAAATGGRVHEALAAYYVPDGEVRRDPLTALLAAQERDVAVNSLGAFSGGDGEEVATTALERERRLASDFQLEQRMVEGYLEWLEETGADAEWEVLGAEQYVEVELEQLTRFARQPVKLIGKLDARVRSRITGQVRFIDHKTVGSLHDPVLGLNQQMLHYNVIGWLLGWGVGAGALYNMLRKVKRTATARPPFYARVPIDHNRTELENYRDKIIGVVTDMMIIESRLRSGESHQVVVYPTSSRDCVWKCQFFKVCRMLDDGSRVEAALGDLYEKRDPLEYYGGREKVE